MGSASVTTAHTRRSTPRSSASDDAKGCAFSVSTLSQSYFTSPLTTSVSAGHTSASGVLFGLLGKLGDKDAINAAADSLGCHIYLLYRLLHRAAGGSTAYFALPEEDCAAGAASAGASLARTDYARALAKLSREKAAFPDMSHETLNSAFPGRSQGMIQVLSTADGQLNRLNQSGLK